MRFETLMKHNKLVAAACLFLAFVVMNTDQIFGTSPKEEPKVEAKLPQPPDTPDNAN